MKICENIRLAREAKGLSQTKMADLLNVSRTTYRNWEEETEPALTIIQSIAKVLEIPAHRLLNGIIDFAEESVSMVNEDELPIDTDVAVIVRRSDALKIKESLDILKAAFAKIS